MFRCEKNVRRLINDVSIKYLYSESVFYFKNSHTSMMTQVQFVFFTYIRVRQQFNVMDQLQCSNRVKFHGVNLIFLKKVVSFPGAITFFNRISLFFSLKCIQFCIMVYHANGKSFARCMIGIVNKIRYYINAMQKRIIEQFKNDFKLLEVI